MLHRGSATVTYRLLGPLEARCDGEVVDLGPHKQRAVLAVLLLHVGEIVSSERLIELVWGEGPPRTAAHSIQIYVSGLRRAIEPEGSQPSIVTKHPGYALDADPDSIDDHRFQRLAAEGRDELRAGDAVGAAARLREALALWDGAPLCEFAYEDFAQEPIRALQALRIDALEELAAAELAQGRWEEALSLVEVAIGENRLRERLWELRMLALYRGGRHPDALRVYQRVRAILGEELGLAPSPSIQRLHERILLHDPALTPGAAGAPGSVRNPYKGLRPFAEEDAGDFFGREGLVAEILASLDAGSRLVALVGPSGCGKSSVLTAGLIPALRADALTGSAAWAIATMMPASQPFAQLERALATDGAVRASEDGSRLLLAIDQFEELFTLTDEAVASRFLRHLSAAVTAAEGCVTVVLTLRANFYDRPLLHRDLAALTASVINVLPMAADELEAAVVDPARRVGVDVEPALRAELVADTANQAGALPLMQYSLTELFAQRTGSVLALEDYRRSGGLRALLSRRSEQCFHALDADQQHVALQMFLRLVNPGGDRLPSRRRVPLRELTALDVDPVALSTVLAAFSRYRLLSFDRDATNGDAVVEIAHEALLWGWNRLGDWIETHRDDLARQRSLAAAADEWEATGRDPDYLITGSRRAETAAWSGRTTLRLTSHERAFMDTALERRRVEQAQEDARGKRQRRLERRSARRLRALAVAGILLIAAATAGVLTSLPDEPPEVALVYFGSDSQVDRGIEAGFDRAAAVLPVDAVKVITSPAALAAELRRQAERGIKVIIAGSGPQDASTVDAVAREYPRTRFVAIDQEGRRSNVTYVNFAEQEGSYLAGVAAALKSRSRVIGFMGGTDVRLIWRFHAGYEAGAHAIDPNIRVRAIYLTRPPDFSGFNSFALGRRAADRLYSHGADVVYHAAGNSGYALFEAARAHSERENRRMWAIGVDSDQYRTISALDPRDLGVSPVAVRKHVLTSMVKRVDRAAFLALADYADGGLTYGSVRLGLRTEALGLAFSGGFIDDIRPQLVRFRERIIAGEISVPTVPASRRAEP